MLSFAANARRADAIPAAAVAADSNCRLVNDTLVLRYPNSNRQASGLEAGFRSLTPNHQTPAASVVAHKADCSSIGEDSASVSARNFAGGDGAGDGNRTRIGSLEGYCPTFRPHPPERSILHDARSGGRTNAYLVS